MRRALVRFLVTGAALAALAAEGLVACAPRAPEVDGLPLFETYLKVGREADLPTSS